MKVVHCKKETPDVYIGRGYGGNIPRDPYQYGGLGNPFLIGMLHKDVQISREKAVELFKQWFYLKIIHDITYKQRILELKGKILGCWCAPEMCHGDIIIDWLEKN